MQFYAANRKCTLRGGSPIYLLRNTDLCWNFWHSQPRDAILHAFLQFFLVYILSSFLSSSFRKEKSQNIPDSFLKTIFFSSYQRINATIAAITPIANINGIRQQPHPPLPGGGGGGPKGPLGPPNPGPGPPGPGPNIFLISFSFA